MTKRKVAKRGRLSKPIDETPEAKDCPVESETVQMKDPDDIARMDGAIATDNDDDDSDEAGDDKNDEDGKDDDAVSPEEEKDAEVEEEGGNVTRKDKRGKSVEAVATTKMISDGRYRNKQRCLVLCSRGVTARYRHLLEDLRTLLPHHKKDSKLDPSKSGGGGIGRAVNEIAEIRGCNTVLFLECRKRQDAYLWIGQTASNGPSAKFHLSNVHTMDELRLTGNCMKGSRPILTFDESFDRIEHLKLLKVLFGTVFGTPRGHPGSKPFVDRVLGFYYADGKIWVRNYQITEQIATNAKEAHLEKKKHGQETSMSLVEIGPRFVLDLIRIFRGSFGGQTLHQNPNFVSPNTVRSTAKRDKGSAYKERKVAQTKRKRRNEEIVLPEDPLDSVFRE